MQISSRADRRRVRRLVLDAMLLSLAMIFSFVEHLLPLPLPGVKLGLANVVVAALFYLLSPVDALVVSLVRICLSALLFGSPVSFYFSLCGGALALLVLFVCRPLYDRIFSFVGVSVLSATGHHLGQIFAAATLYGTAVVLTYLPWLLLSGILTGTLTGILLNVIGPRFEKLCKGALKCQKE